MSRRAWPLRAVRTSSTSSTTDQAYTSTMVAAAVRALSMFSAGVFTWGSPRLRGERMTVHDGGRLTQPPSSDGLRGPRLPLRDREHLDQLIAGVAHDRARVVQVPVGAVDPHHDPALLRQPGLAVDHAQGVAV